MLHLIMGIYPDGSQVMERRRCVTQLHTLMVVKQLMRLKAQILHAYQVPSLEVLALKMK